MAKENLVPGDWCVVTEKYGPRMRGMLPALTTYDTAPKVKPADPNEDPYYVVVKFPSKSSALYAASVLYKKGGPYYVEEYVTVMRGGLVLCDKDFYYSKEVIDDPDK